MRSTIKKQRPSNFNNLDKHESKYFSELLKQKFGDNNQIKNSKQKIHHKFQKIINSLMYPCCGENLVLPNQQTNKIVNLYIMPCSHNICQKCICTIIEFKRNNTISCSHRDCPKTYTTQEADQLFVQNNLVKSFLLKIGLIRKEMIKQTDQDQQSSMRTLKSTRSMINIQSSQQTKVHFESKDLQNDQRKKSTSSQNSQQVFNSCINIFCKKPTSSLFCSKQCQIFQNLLQTNTLFVNSENII